jgi:hypothetical membrane protein
MVSTRPITVYSVLLELYFKIKHCITDYVESETLHILNKILSINLVLTAIVNMDYAFHNITAIIFFLTTSILIFLFGVKIHKTEFRIGQISLFIGILSAIFPMVTFPIVKTLAIPELEHVVLLFTWLLIVEHRDEVKSFLKKFGF